VGAFFKQFKNNNMTRTITEILKEIEVQKKAKGKIKD
jgi:hypothetical protein